MSVFLFYRELRICAMTELNTPMPIVGIGVLAGLCPFPM